MVQLPIYLDNNATTRPDPRVVEAMLPYFTTIYGNAASRSHPFGWAAEEATDKARMQVAALIGAHHREIVFTSGATESNNLALKGVMEKHADKGDHLITVVTEHKAILDSAKHLETLGKQVTYLTVDGDGLINVAQLRNAITDKTVLISVMFGNNEIGTLQPISEIGQLCHERGILFHTDATQGVGKVPVDVNAQQIDLMSFSAHKMHGPKGIGALYVRRKNPRVQLTSQMDGGGHENGFRSGTLNVPGIVGFGMACELARLELEQDHIALTALRDRLYHGISRRIEGTVLNGHPTLRLPNNLNISFEGVEGEALLLGLSDVALSTSSACSSAAIEPSHVLMAIGADTTRAHSAVRFGLSRFSTSEEVDYVIEKLAHVVGRLRGIATQTVSAS